LQKQGVEPQPTTPAKLGSYLQREYETWGRVVKQAKIKAQ
jgi:tripartite-type tricarboxylate transporter receptor subunit TctC